MLDQSKFIKQLAKLVSLKTISSDVQTNQEGLAYIKTLINSDANITELSHQNQPMLIASNCQTKQPQYVYLVHLDVIPGKKNQFELKQQGDRLIGRGTSDMKFSIPLGIALLNELLETELQLDFSLVITTDEETGGFLGAAYLADEYQLRPDLLLVPDGGGPNKFVNKSKGICQIVVSAEGKPAHASQPWKGKNALAPLVKLAAKLSERYEANNSQKSWKTTMNLGQLDGGQATNQVCPQAQLKVDFRYPETNSQENIVNEVTKLARKIDPEISIELGSTGLPTFTNEKLPEVKNFIKNLKITMKKEIKIEGECGASDARHFAPYDIPILMAKPEGDLIHADGEWLSLSSTMKFYQALRKQLGLVHQDSGN